MSELALFRKKLFPTTSQDGDHPRENIDAELSASTAAAVLKFSVLTLVNASFASAPRHAVRNTVLPSGRFSPTVFSRLRAVFLRRSIAADLDLKASSFSSHAHPWQPQ